MAARHPGSLDDFLPACARLAEADIVFYRIAEQINVLEHKGKVFHKAVITVLSDICAAEHDTSAVNVPEPCKKLCDRGLSAARGSYERRRCSFGYLKGDPVDYLSFAV